MDDTEIWGIVFASGHWACGGWTVDGRDRMLICACGADLTSETPTGVAA